MTDRVGALCVVLEKDIRDDDVAPLVDAIRMMRGVLSVTFEPVDGYQAHVARERAATVLGEKVAQVFRDFRQGSDRG